MQQLIKILAATLTRDDQRWLDFGLNMPATDTTPGQVTNVMGTVDEFGNIMLVWDPQALAVRYRVRMLLVGVETV